MELFFKSCGGVLIALILILTLGKQERDISIVLSAAVCCMIGIAALKMMEPVMDYLYELRSFAEFEENTLGRLLRMVGIGLTAELVTMICADAGNASLGKCIQFMASSVILRLSLPILDTMLGMIREIMGGV